MPQVVHRIVRRHDGIVVDGHHQTVVAQEILLDVVEHVVALEDVGLGGHLHVHARELAAGP